MQTRFLLKMMLLTLLLTQISAKKKKLSQNKNTKAKEVEAVADEPVNTKTEEVVVDKETDVEPIKEDTNNEVVKEETAAVSVEKETKVEPVINEPETEPAEEVTVTDPIKPETDTEPIKTEKNENDILAPPTDAPRRERQTFFGFLFFVFGSLAFVGCLCLLFSAFYYRYELQRTKQVPFETPEFLRMIFPNPVKEEIEINNLCMKYLDN